MQRVRRLSLVDSAVLEIREQISSGKWAIGARIPTEAELTELLGMSRASIREAVRSLVQVGLLEARVGDGTYVIADDDTDVALRRHLDASDVMEVIAVRRALDVVAAREAATRRTEDDLATLRESLDLRRDAVISSDPEAFIDADVTFHLGIAEASHNSVLIGLYRSFARSLRGTITHDQCFRGAVPEGVDLHEAMLDAIIAQDVAAATAAALGVIDEQEQSIQDDAH